MIVDCCSLDPVESLWHGIALQRIERATNECALAGFWCEAFLMQAIPYGFSYNEHIPRGGIKSHLDACWSAGLYHREFEGIADFCNGGDNVQYVFDVPLDDYKNCRDLTCEEIDVLRASRKSLVDRAEYSRVSQLLQDEIKQTKEFRKRIYENKCLLFK